MLIKSTSILLHLSRLLSHGIDAVQANLPEPLTLYETAYILTSDQWDMAAKLGHIEVDEPPPMIVFLGGHVGKHLRRIGVVLSQSLSEIGINSAILLFTAYCKRKDFQFRQIIKLFHGVGLYLRVFLNNLERF